MVAISLYRGNLHRVPDTPRRWPRPRPSLSVPQFRRLLRSRSLALSRLAASTAAAIHHSKSPSPSPSHSPSSSAPPADGAEPKPVAAEPPGQETVKEEEEEVEAAKDVDMADAAARLRQAFGSGGDGEGESLEVKSEVTNDGNALDGMEEKKQELGNKLDTLNKKKHDLVQMLKQILNAEEEIKRRSMQAMLRATLPLQAENAADGSSVSRQASRMTVEVNFGDVAGESDAGSNQGTPGRQLHHIHNTSPSAASFARSPFGSLQHNSGHTPRSPATFSMASPSRFAITGHQGHPPGPPSVSVPGGNFVASSPSPAASGGSSSVFRDALPPSST